MHGVTDSAGDGPDAAPRRGRGLLRLVGIVIALAAVALCARTVITSWDTVRGLLGRLRAGGLVLAGIASGAAMVGLGLTWRVALREVGASVGAATAVGWFFAGELGKYVPGGVWAVLGRGELARRSGVPRRVGYASTALAYVLTLAAAVVVAGLLGPVVGGWGWAALAAVPLGLAAAHPRFGSVVLGLVRRAMRSGPEDGAALVSWRSGLAVLSCALPTWVLIGAAAVSITAATGVSQHPAQVAFAAVAAWVVGFVAVPVPAGVGVREIVFVVLCGLPAAPGTTVAVLARALLVLVDALGGAVGLAAAVRHGVATRAAAPR